MNQILAEIRDDTFPWSVDLEDVHLNIEKRLTELVGMRANGCTPAARATTRSPPTCVLAARSRSTRSIGSSRAADALVDLADSNRDGDAGLYAPAGRAAGDFGHHLLAYFEMLKRDRTR